MRDYFNEYIKKLGIVFEKPFYFNLKPNEEFTIQRDSIIYAIVEKTNLSVVSSVFEKGATPPQFDFPSIGTPIMNLKIADDTIFEKLPYYFFSRLKNTILDTDFGFPPGQREALFSLENKFKFLVPLVLNAGSKIFYGLSRSFDPFYEIESSFFGYILSKSLASLFKFRIKPIEFTANGHQVFIFNRKSRIFGFFNVAYTGNLSGQSIGVIYPYSITSSPPIYSMTFKYRVYFETDTGKELLFDLGRNMYLDGTTYNIFDNIFVFENDMIIDAGKSITFEVRDKPEIYNVAFYIIYTEDTDLILKPRLRKPSER